MNEALLTKIVQLIVQVHGDIATAEWSRVTVQLDVHAHLRREVDQLIVEDLRVELLTNEPKVVVKCLDDAIRVGDYVG